VSKTLTPTRTDHVLASTRLAAALDRPDPDVLVRLRRQATTAKQTVSLVQATAIVDGVRDCTSRSDICAVTGLDPDTVLDVVASLGTRMRHTRPGPDFTLVKATDVDQTAMFPAATADGTITVVVPDGFERAGSGRRRDVTQALGSLVASDPTSDEIADWVARQKTAGGTVLEYTVITTVHAFARFGRLDEIDTINAESPELSGTLVAAVELLLSGLRKGLAGYAAIVDGAEGAELTAALAAARPLAEGRIDRLARSIASEAGATKARRVFTSWLADDDTAVPSGIGALDAGQVLRIAQAAGLGSVHTNRTDETAIRSRLADMGLGGASDQLVPAGIRAIRAGLEEPFWEAMELRSVGDEEWDEPLRRAAAGQAANH
jgi:hypothetical protein